MEDKKNFIAGMLTGAFVAVFIGACTISVMVITRNGGYNQDTTNTNLVSVSNQELMADGSVYEKIGMLETVIDQYFIDDVADDVLEEGIYDGIMKSLDDPYAAYYTADELIELTQNTEGIYYGIGAYIQMDMELNYPKISGIIKNTPAEEAGLIEGDIIYKVNDEDTHNMELSDVVSRIKGDEGTQVHLTIVRRETSEEFEIDVTRRKVESPTVSYEKLDEGLAYISISSFDEVTVGQFSEALSDAKSEGMKGLILDLRGNPGGSLPAVVNIAGQILPEGLVVYTEDKYGTRQDYTSAGETPLDIPLVVLVNGGSASASEILAGAIKDYKIGTLIGTTTYGKGIVQRVVPLPDGSAVKLTVSHYYTPLGNDIHKLGIEPDEVLELDVEKYLEDRTDNQLERAKELIKEKIN